MRAARLRSLPVVLALCLPLALGGCGKSDTIGTSTRGGPARAVAAVSAAGAVSVVTRNTTRLGGGDAATDAAAVARAIYPGLTSTTRPQAVVLVNERDWPAALAAAELAGAPLNAPILYSEGNSLPAVSREALEALNPLGSSALEGAQVLRIDTTAVIPTRYVTRSLPAAVGPAMASAVEGLLASAQASTPHQVIVVPLNAPHSLQMPAAGLSANSGAPILFVSPGGVPLPTITLLKALHHPSIYVLDAGEAGAPTLQELRRLGSVTAIPSSAQGEPVSPSANAIAVARFTDGQFGWGAKEPGRGLVFASALKPLDAPAVAPLSATGDYAPLLLLEDPTQVPAALAKYLGDLRPGYSNTYVYRPGVGSYNHGWLIGDETVISAVIQAEIDSLLEISPTKQIPAESSQTQE